MLAARPGVWWDSARVGVGPPPLETPHGWLVLYHGTKWVADGPVHRMGLALLRRGDEWLLAPDRDYEIVGTAPNVVFPTGLVHDTATDQLRLYYGAADRCVALATANLSEVRHSRLRPRRGLPCGLHRLSLRA
ncbi:hypothetical protein [Dactylosporangium sp. NPDC049140]|uniref:glycoside hydrolase family 130 protein n=1 Tax=Dactylosporangium sp. NPDC049140 TaxID=3155647 RepID=UPI0033E4159F